MAKEASAEVKTKRARRIMWFEHDGEQQTLISAEPNRMGDEEYLAKLHLMAEQLDWETQCYFVGGDTGPVKIGKAADIQARLRTLQSCSPVPLKVLASIGGGQSRETAYHYQFRNSRLHGEWFERTPEIEAEIARLNDDAPKL